MVARTDLVCLTKRENRQVLRSSQRGRLGWIAALAGAMVLAAALRVAGLASRPLRNDEAYAWRVTQYPLFDWLERTRHDTSPPLSYLILQVWQQLWGSSVWSLRGLSVLFAVATVPLSYSVCLEAARLGFTTSIPDYAADRDIRARLSLRTGALLSAFLVAVHPSQVVQGRSARMYALGIFLAALTSWLLIKTLREGRHRWWIAFGLAAAAFALTHYYSFFALAAQGVFAGGYLFLRVAFLRSQPGLVSEIRRRAGGLLYAAVLGGTLFSPWLGTFREQFAEVRQGFWIPDASFEHVKQVFWPWCTGLRSLDHWETWAWIGVVVVCLGRTVTGRDPAGWFFLLQAALPWGFALALSLIWKRSIFYDRYLSFAQWGLLCYWGTLLRRFPGPVAPSLLGTFIAISAVAGIEVNMPSGPPVLAQAATFLKNHTRPGEQVWVSGPAEVNRLRYYANGVGFPKLWVRCRVSLAQRGHILHVASLCPEDVLETDVDQNPPARFWQVGESSHRLAGTRQVLKATFRDENGRYTVALYERVRGRGKAQEPAARK